MRLPFTAFILSFAALLSTTQAYGLFESTLSSGGHLSSRALAANVNLCATVNIDVPLTTVTACTQTTVVAGATVTTPVVLANLAPNADLSAYQCTRVTTPVRIAENICLCVAGGVLTGDSAARLSAIVQGNSAAVQSLLRVTSLVAGYTRSSLVTAVNNIVYGLLGSQSTTCQYPTGSIPRDCGTCNYDCPANLPQLCGTGPGQCIAADRQCISGQPVRRRDWVGDISDLNCPKGKTACALPSMRFARAGFECLDTQNDLESCGACVNPLPGRPVGVDCTAIAGALDVECVAGSCVIRKCQAGWKLAPGATTCVEGNGKGSAGKADNAQQLYLKQQRALADRAKAAVAKRQASAKKIRLARGTKVTRR